MRSSVLFKNALSCSSADGASLVWWHCAKDAHHVIAGARDEHFPPGFKDVSQTGPFISDNRRSAGCSLEQPNTGRPASAYHFRASDVQRKALRIIKCPVRGRL